MRDSTAKPLMLQAAGRAFARVGRKHADQRMLEFGQRLLSLSSQQPTEGPTMSEKQSDIAERLRVMADAGADDMREAADEIEALRADLDKSAKLALSAVRAERAAIVAIVDTELTAARSLHTSDEYKQGSIDTGQAIAADIKARGEI